MKTSYNYYYNKIIEIGYYEQMSNRVQQWKSEGKRIVFTNGCFDAIHYGHIDSLTRASQEGDTLIVGLNSDKSVAELKGKDRPVYGERTRAIVLSSLHCVDMVAVFEELTPETLIKTIRPDILAKGSDYKADEITGADFVKSYGGDVVRLPILSGYSTTELLTKFNR